jgi:hypothetical protein
MTYLTTQPQLLASAAADASGVTDGPSLLSGGLTGLTPALSSPDSIIAALESANTNTTNAVTNAVSTSYATLLPTADIATALVTSVPTYDVNLFLDGVERWINGDPVGGLVNAFGDPIAADVGLTTLAGGFELISLENAFGTILTGAPHPGPG